jgi:PIN domain nuclease of toxin-antitoxin system
VTSLLLDTHVVLWLDTAPEQLSRMASDAIERADQLAVAPITWFELAWLAQNRRIDPPSPVRIWLESLFRRVITTPFTPAIAMTAVSLPESFPRDPADRMIYATAIENGWQLVTRDERLRDYRFSRQVTVW